jgi:hypothetical protein
MESRQLISAGPIRDDRVDILGVGVSSINLDDAVATIERRIGERSSAAATTSASPVSTA